MNKKGLIVSITISAVCLVFGVISLIINFINLKNEKIIDVGNKGINLGMVNIAGLCEISDAKLIKYEIDENEVTLKFDDGTEIITEVLVTTASSVEYSVHMESTKEKIDNLITTYNKEAVTSTSKYTEKFKEALENAKEKGEYETEFETDGIEVSLYIKTDINDKYATYIEKISMRKGKTKNNNNIEKMNGALTNLDEELDELFSN